MTNCARCGQPLHPIAVALKTDAGWLAPVHPGCEAQIMASLRKAKAVAQWLRTDAGRRAFESCMSGKRELNEIKWNQTIEGWWSTRREKVKK